MVYLIAFITGITIVIAMVQNANLANSVGVKQSTLMNFISGLTAVLIIFLLTKESFNFITLIPSTHILGYFGGLLGIIVVASSTIILKKVSVIAATMLMYAGQLIMGLLIDATRGTDLSIGKIIGCVLIIAGVYFNTLVDQRMSTKTITE